MAVKKGLAGIRKIARPNGAATSTGAMALQLSVHG
jgi:hypothetical protein